MCRFPVAFPSNVHEPPDGTRQHLAVGHVARHSPEHHCGRADIGVHVPIVRFRLLPMCARRALYGISGKICQESGDATVLLWFE